MERNERAALVTGAGNGIGKAAAEVFAAKGYSVVVADLDGDAATRVADSLVDQGVRALPVVVDIADSTSCDAMVDAAIATFGRLDVAVNNAAVGQRATFEGPDSSMIHEMSDVEWNRLIDVNLSGTFYCVRAEMRHMIGRGGGGAIVNVSSSTAVLALEGYVSYVASKKGLAGLTEVAALEGGRHQIRVNTVIPANVVGTKMFASTLGSGPDAERDFGANSPLGRPAQPIDIANACCWACSDEAGYVSGTSILVDGATTVRHPSSRRDG